MRILSYVLFPFSLILLIILFIPTILLASFIALPFPKDSTRTKITAPFWKLFCWAAPRAVFLSSVYVEDRRDKKIQKTHTPPGLYIANHQSFVDVPLFLSKATIPPVMKKEVLYIPLFGLCGYAAGGIIVDRKSKNSRKKVLLKSSNRLLHSPHKSLMYYPEGTRRKDGIDKPKDFSDIKLPLMRVAYKNNVPVFPVAMYGTNKVLNKNSTINYFKKIGIVLSEPIEPNNFSNEDDFLKACWGQVQKDYSKLEEKLS